MKISDNSSQGNNDNADRIKRRAFLKNSALLSASVLVLPLSGFNVIDVLDESQNINSIPYVKLNNGIPMPILGFGTNTLRGDVGTRCVYDAISVGYRLIDTAHIYGNEESVGAGIKKSGINREELFITSKLWVDDAGYESTKKAFQTSIDKLGVEYLDLYLIHRPRGDVKGSWKAMEELHEKGKIKAIGVSNFDTDQLKDLMGHAKVKPAVNQIESHVFFQQPKAYEYLNKNEIQMEAWSPFAAGRNGIFENKTLAAVGEKYDKSNAQVCLRWHYERGVVAIPRSSQKAHMIENLDIFDFQLDDSDFQAIAKLDLNTTQFPEWE
jgi:2,5-diketo-D-gluconate reductase A